MKADTGHSPRLGAWRDSYRRLLRSAGRQAPALRLCLAGLLAAAVAQGLALACLFPLFAAVFHLREPGDILFWLGLMSGLALAATVLRWHAQGFEYNGRLASMTHQLRGRLGEQLRRMPLASLQDRRAGEMNALLLGNVDEHFNYTPLLVNLILLATVTPLVTALATLLVDWRLGLALLLVFPAIVPFYRWRRPASGRHMRQLAQAHQRTSADLVEYTQGLPVLRAACSAGDRAATLQAGSCQLQQIQTEAHRRGSKAEVLTVSVVELGLLLVVAIGVSRVVTGTLDLAVLAAVMVIVARFSEPLATFVSYTMALDLIESALERIDALLAVEPLPQQLPVARPGAFDVHFDDVSFQYPRAGDKTLDRFSATVPARSLTAIVGPSGAGKSTVVRLLMRHFDPQQGRITLGGVDLRQIPAEELNSLISVVFQEVYLFDDSILANVRMARPDASDEAVQAALHQAQCTAFIKRLPQGWHTRLGDIGGRLSGGERQRISIARALLKEAPVVILDEPTAALDTESEVAVQHAIDTLVRDKTVIVIAHRLSTIAGADQILVLDPGLPPVQGRHAELLKRSARYAAMWAAQQSLKVWRADGARPAPQ